jgi:hypothetical protein
MALQLEHVGGIKVRMRGSFATPEDGVSAGQLLAYVVSGLAGALFGVHVTGPIVARLFFG